MAPMDDARVAPLWLVAHDFSDHADAAAHEAATELARRDGTMALLHVYTIPAATMPMDWTGAQNGFAGSADFEGIIRSDVEERLLRVKERLVAAFPGLFVETIARAGAPAETILQVARELDVDRIVVGTHGRTGLMHLVSGSVAERVARLAQVPVLVVKSPHEHAARAP